jgi:rhodanese-related sulfurtransferase
MRLAKYPQCSARICIYQAGVLSPVQNGNYLAKREEENLKILPSYRTLRLLICETGKTIEGNEMRLKKLWILALLATFTLFTVLSSGCIGNQDTAITPSLAYSIIEDNESNTDFVILDIRTPEEYANERIAESVLLDFYADDFENALDKLDKSKTYLVYCRSGNRSSKSMSIMEDLGFIKIYDMGGGINQWKAERYPTVK